MSSTETQKGEEKQLELSDLANGAQVNQKRRSGDSTPGSSESDDFINELAVQSFDRFRRRDSNGSILSDNGSVGSVCNSPAPQGSIAEYCSESLYSYSFTPLSRVNKATQIKKQILNRGMDYMQRIRWNAGVKDAARRFSEPEIGIADEWNEGEQLKPCPSMVTMPTDNALAETSSTLPTREAENEEELLARRKTIEVFNNLPPIYEVPLSEQSISPQYTRALHAPSRFLPQNQAILTTNADGTILLFNEMASLCFGIDKNFIGKSILSAIEQPFQKHISRLLKQRRDVTSIASQMPITEDQENRVESGLVLVCGIVISIRKMAGETSSAASLWLKEKKTDGGKTIYIWIFEEIYESSLSAYLDDQGIVKTIQGATKDLFGYEPEEIMGKPITLLIPTLNNGNVVNPGVNLQKLDNSRFFGGRSNTGVCFPTMVTAASSPTDLKIVSLPSIAGLITVHSNGKIQSINPVPAKYLFGYSTETLVEKFDIDQIIPKFSEVVAGLRKSNLLQYSSTVNNHACRWAISDLCTGDRRSSEVRPSLKAVERLPSVSKKGQVLPLIHAVHRDGSQFEIQLQLRLIESELGNLISVWVTYDRIHALKRQIAVAAKNHNKEHIVNPPAAVKSSDELRHPLSTTSVTQPSPSIEELANQKASSAEQKTDGQIKKRPPIRTFGISSFGSVDKNKALFPQDSFNSNKSSSEDVRDLGISEKADKPHPMDQYVIIGTLGEGAYGTAKLAYRKDDESQTKVVVKFIAKSRIIIDSWIRDRQLGLIPLEIHILNKLKESPQENCCALLDYMEDDDNYFAVMKMHGSNSMDLFDYIELNEHISENEVRNIFRQVVLAVKHIQDLCIVHRDIKDENVLLDDNGCVHLIDFGSAAYFRKGRTFDTFGGTLDYCAPEILKGIPYEGPKQDIWSLGTLLYTLIYRENPFYNVDEILEHDLRIPFVLSDGSLDLITKMLNRNVDKRFNIEQILEHPWLKSTTASK